MDRRDFIKYGTVLAGIGGACFFCKGGIFTQKTAEINTPVDTRPCKTPFTFCEIHKDVNIYPCAPEFLKYKNKKGELKKVKHANFHEISAGNIKEQDFDEIWNGELFNDLRQRVLKGDYSMCSRDICSMYTPCSEEEIPLDYKKGPKELKISYDLECNYNCITCRDTIITNTPEEMSLYENVYLPKIKKIIKNVEIISLLGSGEPLFSRHSRHLMSEIIKEKPDIKIYIDTNGFLLDEKTLDKIGIKNNLNGVCVSVNAVNRETYKKILRTDAFGRVMKNIELMAEWKKQGKIKWLVINFVIHLLNYKEMPDFVKLAQKLDVTAAFTTYRPWTWAEFHKRYDEVAVFEPKNPHYKEFAEILHDPIFKDTKHCHLEPRLLDIANS